MGAVLRFAGLMLGGALGIRVASDAVGDNVQKITPVLIAGIGASGFVAAAYIYSNSK